MSARLDDPAASAQLYTRIRHLIDKHAALTLEDTLRDPLFHALTTDRFGLLWTPKATESGAIAECICEDPLLQVDLVRMPRPTKLYIRFRLKRYEHNPIRCVVVLDGRVSIRLAINGGRVGRRRTFAEVLLDLPTIEGAAERGVSVEVVREATLLHVARVRPRPRSARQWASAIGLAVSRIARAPFVSTWRLRKVRVKATRLLEESFRIKAN